MDPGEKPQRRPRVHRPPEDRSIEIESLARRIGPPHREEIRFPPGGSVTGPAGFPTSSKRTSEIVLVIPRGPDRVLVHTKGFYPAGVWRLPTGGLHPGESIEAGTLRESQEETGHELAPKRFLFHLRFTWEDSAKRFESYGFLTQAVSGKITSRDPHEKIAAFRDVNRAELEGIARHLEHLGGRWLSWGRFRSVPHRILLEIWPPGRPAGAIGEVPTPPRA